MTKIAVVDDQDLLRDSLTRTLDRAGYKITAFSHPAEALASIKKDAFDLIVSDLKMPEMDGVELLKRVRSAEIDIPFVLMTAYGTVSTAVEAMKLGAYDYIQKPFEAEEIELLVERALREHKLHAENEALRRTVGDWYQDRELVGDSPVINQLKDLVSRLGPSDATVLIEGESGTGKELISRAIHAASPRAHKPLLCLNCAALSENLLESELFGHEKGAFTGADKLRKGRFELADGGTLLLDEISEIPLTLQAKLLRVLQEKQFERVGSSVTRDTDVRVIATTNRNLLKWIDDGKFRQDLYYRLSVLPVRIAPLRDRREDIETLADYFLERLARRDRRPRAKLSPAARKLLSNYDWPGNVRELENIIERAWVLTTGREIGSALIQNWLRQPQRMPEFDTPVRPGHILEDAERQLVVKTLERYNGHRARTAKALGIGLRTLGLKLKRWQEEGQLQGADFARSAQLVH